MTTGARGNAGGAGAGVNTEGTDARLQLMRAKQLEITFDKAGTQTNHSPRFARMNEGNRNLVS